MYRAGKTRNEEHPAGCSNKLDAQGRQNYQIHVCKRCAARGGAGVPRSADRVIIML